METDSSQAVNLINGYLDETHRHPFLILFFSVKTCIGKFGDVRWRMFLVTISINCAHSLASLGHVRPMRPGRRLKDPPGPVLDIM